MAKNKVGRPTIKDQDTVRKLESLLREDMPIDKACELSGIGRRTFYEWMESDPEFSHKINEAQEYPHRLARRQIVKSIEEGDGNLALRYESMRDKRYIKRQETQIVEHSVEDIDKRLDEYENREQGGDTK